MSPHSWPHSNDHFVPVTSKLSGTQSRLSRSLYTLKEFATHLLGKHAPATFFAYISITFFLVDDAEEVHTSLESGKLRTAQNKILC